MKILPRLAVILLIIMPFLAYGAQTAQPTFKAGEEYDVLPSSVQVTPNKNGKITVVEFFSYECPFCFHMESALEPWLKTKPANVDFSRSPVVFQPSWQILAKAYYVANALGIESTFTPAFFDALHKKNLNVSSEAVLETFFMEQGVSKQQFENAYNYSPQIDAELAQGDKMMKQYGILAIPAFIINGQYKTDLSMVDGNTDKLMQVVNYLVQLATQQQGKTN